MTKETNNAQIQLSKCLQISNVVIDVLLYHNNHNHNNNNNNNHHHHLANTQFCHLLSRSGLKHLEVSLMVSPGFFCLSVRRCHIFI